MLEIREATAADVVHVHAMILELARYERAEHEVVGTESDLRRALFPDVGTPHVFCDVAMLDGEHAGFAVWFLNYSTWLAAPGIYLEDLYVCPTSRRAGVGQALLARLAARCVERGYGRLDWAVLDWNEPAIRFYEALGAEALTSWRPHRITGDALVRLARRRQPVAPK